MTAKLITLAPPEVLRAKKRMTELVLSFPCLEGALGVEPFDAEELDRWAADPISHGQRITAQFILWVWDGSTDWGCGRFDLAEALHIWPPEHHQAFLRWAANPWWP